MFYRLGAENLLPARIRRKCAEPITANWLAPFTIEGNQLGDVRSQIRHRISDKGLLSLKLVEYIKLPDWVGRQRVAEKKGAIPSELAPILERLGIASEALVETVENFPKLFRRLAGTAKKMKQRAQELGRKCLHGVRAAAKVFR